MLLLDLHGVGCRHCSNTEKNCKRVRHLRITGQRRIRKSARPRPDASAYLMETSDGQVKASSSIMLDRHGIRPLYDQGPTVARWKEQGHVALPFPVA